MNQLHVETPLWESRPLSQALGTRVLLKMEAFQPTATFKIRGVGNLCQEAVRGGARGLVCSSGGNAGYAVAWAGRRLGTATTVVLPRTTSRCMRDILAREDAEVLEHGRDWDEAHVFAQDLAARTQAVYVHPFDDPLLWTGHATLVSELVRQSSKPGAVVVSVGGGGLLCGLLEGLDAAGWGDVPVVAVETAGADALAKSMAAGRLVTLDAIRSVATSLGARTVAVEALARARAHSVFPVTVSDREAVGACLRFADDHRVLVEPACGASLAAVYGCAAPLADRDPVVVILCGGAGVTLSVLDTWRREVM